MQVQEIDAFVLKVPSPGTYWGKAAWATPSASGPPEYPPYWRMRAAYSELSQATVVRLKTDTGLVGWGEAKAPVAPSVARDVIHELLRDIVYGTDPLDVHVTWERMYASMRLRGHSQGFLQEAMSAVDIALWDLAGQALKVPVSYLLGGRFRQKVWVYGSGIPGARTPSAEELNRVRQMALDMCQASFTAVKVATGLGLEADAASLEVVREAVGLEVAVFTDAAGRYDLPGARRLGRVLERLDVGFFEAPLPPEHIADYARLAASLDVPLALDLLVNHYQARDFLIQGAIHVVQPDVCRSGGITGTKRICDLADDFGQSCAPHLSIGTALQLAASLQIAASVPNLLTMEFPVRELGQNPLGNAILAKPFTIENGYATVPDGPGLGIELDEAALLAHAV